ncbi:hypothetical protein QN277_000536 [Acacia crassicarpa]|uniref:F-box domain-containing protein n=1 Tax=Acacia crassicarpa TaxID=499986 RepID=A0AAE1N5D9_9FABA|nr:hypothetical protein QN277_000536 [Acacia crassicarpa]
MENLPDHLRIEILLRLPVKSLARLKCVSKSWLSLISDPNFPKLHFQRSTLHYTHRFPYLVQANQMRAIDLNASLHDDSAAISFDFPSDYDVNLVCCRGFLLLLHKKGDKLLVWNPSTGERKQILLPKTCINFELHGFCYDESSDDYLIVLASLGCGIAFRVFSIRTNSWNREFAFNHPASITPLYPEVAGSVVNGVIHWLVRFHEGQIPENNILALDLKTDKVRQIVPKLDDFEPRVCYLRVFGESLALIDATIDYNEINVWEMKECGGKSSWTKVMSIPRNSEVGALVSPLCLTKDGQLVTLHSYLTPLTLSKWSSEQGKLEGDRICNSSLKGYCCFAATPLYTETLLSLPSQQS